MTMQRANILVLTMLLGVAAVTSSAFAQASRDATIHKCIIEAQKMFPNNDNDQAQRARTDVYMSCMRSAGMNP